MNQTVVAGAAGGTGSPPSGGARLVRRSAELLLLALPSAHLLYLPVGGAVATGADLFLLLFLLAWAVGFATGAVGGAVGRAPGGGDAPDRFLRGGILVCAFAVYVALSGLWGFHEGYALAKGAGTLALVLAAMALATSGISWERAVDAWLGGTALALAFAALALLPGDGLLHERLVYEAGGILGLPFARISGPLLHPNMLGDYLVVSGVLAWARWPSLSPRGGLLVGGLLAAGVVALFLTASTAWLTAGLAVAWLARWSGRRAGPDGEERGGRGAWWVPLARVGGTALSAVTVVALVIPLELSLGPLSLATSGIRPRIWAGAVEAVAEAPLLGVGAAPFLARAVDPLTGGDPVLWDAHNAYLSVLGQFGVLGSLLLAGGLLLMVRGALRGAERPRVRTALVVALLCLAVNAVFMASEDLRHAWLLVGMCGLAGAAGREEGPS